MPEVRVDICSPGDAVAGDNCRDPFHAHGDHDMPDTWRQAVRILLRPRA